MSSKRLFSRGIVVALAGVALLAGTAGCKAKSKIYDAKVKLNRVSSIRFATDGKPMDADVEFDWFECPGEQVEIIRGDAPFGECMKKYKVGDEVKVKVDYHWDKKGFYDWDITEMGGCKRPPDDDDQSSFDTVQECEPIVVNGVEEGFKCNRIPQKALLKKCPWFARH
jgi:hypothetical protein